MDSLLGQFALDEVPSGWRELWTRRSRKVLVLQEPVTQALVGQTNSKSHAWTPKQSSLRFFSPTQRAYLVAQCSATGVIVAATPL